MKYYGILFTRDTRKPIKRVVNSEDEGYIKMYAIIKTYAINKKLPYMDFIIFNEHGVVTCYLKGKKNNRPVICKDMIGKHVSEFGFNMADILKKQWHLT